MISEIIEKWIKGILIDGITGNLSGLFDNVNAKVGEIASDVGSTPQAWNSGIFNMLRSLSETVVLPIAAAILALVMCHELIQMITEKNNMLNLQMLSSYFMFVSFPPYGTLTVVCRAFLMIRSRTFLDGSKGFVLFSEEYKKSEPFSYRKKVRILLLWCG